jgi:hypothetical protein
MKKIACSLSRIIAATLEALSRIFSTARELGPKNLEEPLGPAIMN